MYQAYCQVLKIQQSSKADRIQAITESIYKEERKVCSMTPVYGIQDCAIQTTHRFCKITDTWVDALNTRSPGLGHRIPETSGAFIKPRTLSRMKWTSVL